MHGQIKVTLYFVRVRHLGQRQPRGALLDHTHLGHIARWLTTARGPDWIPPTGVFDDDF